MNYKTISIPNEVYYAMEVFAKSKRMNFSCLYGLAMAHYLNTYGNASFDLDALKDKFKSRKSPFSKELAFDEIVQENTAKRTERIKGELIEKQHKRAYFSVMDMEDLREDPNRMRFVYDRLINEGITGRFQFDENGRATQVSEERPLTPEEREEAIKLKEKYAIE